MKKDKVALDGKRIALSSEAFAVLEMEVNKLKQKGAHFKLNEAKLASVLIEIFGAKYLDRERKRIEAIFFDKKSYLKVMIEKSTSETDLSNSLKEFFIKSKAKKTERTKVTEAGSGATVS
ncbi:MAG: hypothetical protein AABY64_09605 [Bdellovibrionota bacterium]